MPAAIELRVGTSFAVLEPMEQRNVGRWGRHRTDLTSNSQVPEPAGLTDFRGTLDLVEDHLQGPRGHVMPALSLSPDVEDVVAFRIIRDRRRYLAHVLPYRERRTGFPRYGREPLRSRGDIRTVSMGELPELQQNRRGASRR